MGAYHPKFCEDTTRATSVCKGNLWSAYVLPHGGNQVRYPSITSVNAFRLILDYYFNLGLGLLEDRVYEFDLEPRPIWPAERTAN